MNNKPNIILTGFMATGKSTVGRLLSKALDYEFVDTDTLIVKKAGISVAEIFETRGEPAFRKMEADLAIELSRKQGLVIATGGGMLINPENADVLSQTGRIFCLTATPEEILDRVMKDTGAKRPLMESDDPLNEIKKLLDARKKAYKKFPLIDTSDRTPRQIVSAILDEVKAAPDSRP